MSRPDLIGRRYGALTVLAEVEPRRSSGGFRRRRVRVRCDCGSMFELRLG